MINLMIYSIFETNKTTLRETSKDDSNPVDIKYMTSSDLEAINFDLVKRHYANMLGLSEEVASSVDAVIQMDGHISFIEFKNGKVNNRNIKDKIRDTLLIFSDITGINIDYSRNNIDLIVVYNLEKNPLPNQFKKGKLQETPSRIAIAKHFAAKAKEPVILFDLERYKKLYFREIRTYSQEEFEEFLRS